MDVAPSLRGHVVATIVSAALLSLPLLVVHFPPITDLPQQAAQVRLLGELSSGGTAYRLNLAAPGALAYGVFELAWLVVGSAHAGRVAYLLLAIFWMTALGATARNERRDPELIPLAGLFFLSHVLYWGFFSFLFGGALFLLWRVFERRARKGPGGVTEIAALALFGLALYSTHLLWFLASAAWLAAVTLAEPMSRRRRLLRLASLLPGFLALAAWAPRLAESGFSSQTVWWTTPWNRLAPSAWVDRILGGIKGPVEPVVLSALAVWIALGLWQNRGALRRRTATTLLALGGSMLALSLLLPDRHQNTLHFAARWAPVGTALLVLALPPPTIRRLLRGCVAFTLLVTMSVSTTAVWRAFERLELAGLEASLAALPDEPRLLGLDFYRFSQLVKTQPFFQMSAYGQVLRGGTLGFSFASFPTSPVVFRHWDNPPWTPGLEWMPHEILDAIDDVLFFDTVLINADPAGHAFFEQQPVLVPVTPLERWRLYRVAGPSPRTAPAQIE